MREPAPKSVLFVCLGNICRSPLAKAIFVHQVQQLGLSDRYHIDSCGTGHWHAGRPADPRSILIAQRNGVTLEHVARQVQPALDFVEFDLIIAMDRRNQADLLTLGAPHDRVKLMRSFDPALAHAPASMLDVPDPYTGSTEGFQLVYDMLWSASRGLVESLRTEPSA
jgi:protein-tyrosine phosphatase